MSEPVNLDNLREMTGGDPTLEAELFGVYLSAAEDCLRAMKGALAPGQEEDWRAQAHAWKGMSLNLGAEALGALCAQAQQNPNAPQDKKTDMITAIETEYERVKAYLKNL